MNQTVLFLCPHNAAKSVIASAYFNQMAQAAGLSWRGDSAGTEPSEAVAPVVVEMMTREGLDVSQFKPRHTSHEELHTVARVISIGCTPDELGDAAARVEYWDDVPMVSEDAEGSRAAIKQHVEQLVSDLTPRSEAPYC
jgi:arsenate reductase (thioredoxin)